MTLLGSYAPFEQHDTNPTGLRNERAWKLNYQAHWAEVLL